MIHKVYFVGAGPGEPGLITVRGLEIVRQAEVVIYDYLVNKRILEEAKPDTELICCDTLGKKRYANGFTRHQEKINQLIVKKAKKGKKVIRLKNGDVSIFSRLSQELEYLKKNKIDFELVPGVTAASAASCFSGIPLTSRKFASSIAIVTGVEDPLKKDSLLDWDSLSEIGTLVLYMAVNNLKDIVKELLKVGKPKHTPCAIIQDASQLTQRILTSDLENITQEANLQKIKPPAIIIIGEVVNFEKEFNWLKKARRILYTGLSKERFFQKAIYFHLPLIKIEPLADYKEFDNYLKGIKNFNWVVFASRFGVEYFFQRLKKLGIDVRILKDISIACIGNSTKNRLLESGIFASLVPKKESSEGLIEEFKKIDLKDKKIFLPRSDLSDKGLERALERLGARITSSFAYKNTMPKDLPDLDLNFFDEIIFTSPSIVRNFIKRYGYPAKKVRISCIGDVTLRQAQRQGFKDAKIAKN
jgi:uroporphyrinogen III methyltransferase/synthase